MVKKKDFSKILDEIDNQILKQVQVPAKSGDIAARLDLSKNTILRRIEKLEKLGLVEKRGSGPKTSYSIIPTQGRGGY